MTTPEKANRLRKFAKKILLSDPDFKAFNDNFIDSRSRLDLHGPERIDPEIFDAMLEERYIPVYAKFVSKEAQYGSILRLLINGASIIYDRLSQMNDKEGFILKDYNAKYGFNPDGDYDVISTGFLKGKDGFFHEFNNNTCIGIYIQRDTNMPFGFLVKAANPGVIPDV